MAAKPGEGEQKAGEEIVERDIVIARDHDPGEGEGVEEIAGCNELRAAGALGEVAADQEEIGGRCEKILQKSGSDCRIFSAEVEVGDVGDGAHEGLPLS